MPLSSLFWISMKRMFGIQIGLLMHEFMKFGNWTTNSSIGVLCLWLVWYKKENRLSTLLSLIVTGGFLLAFFLKEGYGGSMKYLDGSEKTVLGINIGILGFGIAFLFLILSHVLTKTKKTTHDV